MNAQENDQAINCYGQIKIRDGHWRAAGEHATELTSEPDTIPEYDVPYKYVVEKLTDDDFTGFTTLEYTYEIYLSGRKMKLAIDLLSRVKNPSPCMAIYHGVDGV